ncbi:MAG TPA: lipoate--protein ligase [Chitinophagales bacterium]|nr:lipoate--protein ligase [Chitinophagales bacterium]HRP39475.1 lipoate--protein ligase [Chitinophagales bacterium]
MITFIEVPQHFSPFFYAALEEWLVRNCDCFNTDYLLLYVNKDCAVVGKNQCVYKELNFNYWFNESAKVVRRVSGGGTVFHDSGNLNFAFISKFEEWKVNNYKHFNEPIRQHLNLLQIPAQFNARNDMVANGKKISGNAQFTDRKNIISHGTLLVNSDLAKMSAALKHNSYQVETKAVSSVRSEVANISSFNNALTNVEDIRNELAEKLCISSYSLNHTEIEEITQLQKEKYETLEWRFGRSPDCEIQTHTFSISIAAGIVSQVKYESPEFTFLEKIVGIPFFKDELLKNISSSELEKMLEHLR